MLATSIADITACEDAAECKSVDNIITILTHYHYWNEEQLQKNPQHSTINYASLLSRDNENDCEFDDESITQNRTIHPQLTKSSASIKNISKYESIICEFMDDAKYGDIALLNDFSHCLDKHCFDDREFEYIYFQLTKESEIKSKISKSNNILHRHNYSRDILYRDIELIKKLYYGYYESKEIHQFEILDKIYIHFLHSYNFGFRMEPNQKLLIESEEEERLKLESKSDKDPEINIDKTLGVITEKLTFLKMNLTKFDSLKSRFNVSNRFVTNYNDVMLLNAEFDKNMEEIKLNIEDDDDNNIDDSKSNKSNMSKTMKPALTNKFSNNRSNSKHNKSDTLNKMEMESLQQLATIQGKSNEALEADAHLIGKRWHYSKNTENNTDIDSINGGISGDWYIPTKYKNIKREILDNSIYNISMNAWIFNYEYALILMKTEKAKNTVRAMGDRWKTFYDENQSFEDLQNPSNIDNTEEIDNDKDEIDMFSKPKQIKNVNPSHRITINHILAILFYCNFNELSRYFRATYIDDDKFQSFERWKQQHSEFANLGRLIRDSIEDYGTSISDHNMSNNNKTCYFYHGLDGYRIIFNTTMIRFCAPISTSPQYSIISMYIDEETTDQSGIILECKEYSKYLRFFSCDWISNGTPSENEQIFAGGDWPLRINSILDFGVSSYNYKYYLCAINIIQDLIRGEYNHECEYISNKIKYAFNQIISSRLWMRDAIPTYIDRLFDKYCDNLGLSIEINMEFVNIDCRGYIQIKSSIIDETQNDRIKFDVLCCVFSNVMIFKFLTYKLCKETFNYLFQFLSEKKHKNDYESKLKYIIFSSPNECNLSCKNIIKFYQKKYKQINWFIDYKKKDQFGQPVLLISDHKIKMDDCLIM